MPTKNKTFVAVLVLGVCGFLAAAHLGAQASIKWLLNKDSSAVGMDWSHLLADRISVISGGLDNHHDGAAIDVTTKAALVDFENLISSIFSIGNIYQVDFIDIDCHCLVSYGSYVERTEQSKNHEKPADAWELNDHKHHLSPSITQLNSFHGKRERLLQILAGDNAHEESGHDDAHDMLLPLRPGVFEDNRMLEYANVKVHFGLSGHQPNTVGETYHPMLREGGSPVIIRTLVNLDQAEATYTTLHYQGIAGLLLLMGLVLTYPFSKYLKEQIRRLHAHERLNIIANQDALTKLANRNAFQEYAPELLKKAEKEGFTVSLQLFDVDNFKDINDYHGHEAGDLVLKEVANHLRKIAPEDSMVARLGGDEIAVLYCQSDDSGFAKSEAVNYPIFFEVEISGSRQKLSVSASSGVAYFPRDSRDLTELMRHADLALYSAKKKNKAAMCKYEPDMGLAFRTRLDLFSDFRAALQDSEIIPFYQPILCTQTGRVDGLEALARWRQPDGSIVNANAFKDVLDDRKICELVGLEMLQRVTADMRSWKLGSVPFKNVGINVDIADLMRPAFEMDVVTNITLNGLSRGELIIEVTEDVLFDNNRDILLTRLRQLHNVGCFVALDDFGTGFSSITHLKDLPLSSVKIDRSFLGNLAVNKFDQAVVKSLISLGDEFGFKVVAEGVERKSQSEQLLALGCQYNQGHLYSMAVCADEVPELLRKLNSETIMPLVRITA